MSDRIARMGRELEVNVAPMVVFTVGVVLTALVALVR